MRFSFVGLTGIIVNYHWYAEKVLEIDFWCLQTFGYQPRNFNTLTFQEESHKMLFFLRWS